MDVVVVTQARLGSSRLPNKVLKKIESKTLLQIHLERIQKAAKVSEIIVATTDKEEDGLIEEHVNDLKITVYRGSENNVLDRFYQAVKNQKPDLIVRLTSDCPLIDPDLLDMVIEKSIENNVDYCSNTLLETFPDGQDIEVFTFKALETAWNLATLDSEKEHVTPYIKKNSTFNKKTRFSALNILSDFPEYKDVRMTVDEPEDFKMISLLIDKLGENESWLKYAELYNSNENIKSLNKDIIRNEGYLKSISKES